MSANKGDPLSGRIFTVRGGRVILDADLARMYGVTTKRFNQAIKRNSARFPSDFGFRLTAPEYAALRSQIVTLDKNGVGPLVSEPGSRGAHRKYLPWAFTEHGAVMAANVLRSPKAVQMSVYVVRAFIQQREALATNATVLKRLAEIDKTLLEHDSALLALWKRLQPLLAPPPEPPRRRIGFHARNG